MRKTLCLLLCLFSGVIVFGQTISPSSATTFCEGGSVTLTVSGANGNPSFQWIKDGANISGATSSTFVVTASGSYSVSLSGGAALTPVDVTVNPKPAFNFSFTNNNACAGTSIQFTPNITTGTAPFTYDWDFGDAGTSSQQSPTHSYSSFGCGTVQFTVKLKVTDANGCTNTVTNLVDVKQVPDIDMKDAANPFNQFSNCKNSPSTTNPNFAISLAFNTPSPSCAASYTVSWGDGNTQSNLTAANFPLPHTYTQLGTFDLVVTVTGTNGCTYSKTYKVVNQSNPAVGILAPGNTTGCAPVGFWFKLKGYELNSPGTTYTWDFGDGTPLVTWTNITIDSIFHDFNATSCTKTGGQFIVKVTATNGCKSTTATVDNITVYIKPTAGFTTPASGCANTSVNFVNATVGGYNQGTCDRTTLYSWDFGDPNSSQNTSTATNPSHTYSLPGVYTVMLIAEGSCGKDTVKKTICIVAAPTASFTLDKTEGCAPLTVAATNTSSTLNDCVPATYQWTVTYTSSNCGTTSNWNFANNANASSTHPSFSITNPGTYTIKLSVTNSCGTVNSTKTVVIKRPPTVTINTIPNACGATTFTPAANVTNCGTGILTYSWVIDGGAPITTANPGSLTFNTPGIHTVSLTVSNECGSASDTKSFVVNPVPALTIPTNQTFCPGQTAGPYTFTSTTSGATILWSASGPSINLPSPSGANTIGTFTTTNSTASALTATINVTANASGCTNSSSFTITVNPKPANPTVTTPVNYCQNETAAPLTATAASGHTLLWYTAATGGTGSTTAPTPSTSSVGSVPYYVSQINTTTGCESGRAIINVAVKPVPSITAAFTNPTSCASATGKIVISGLITGSTYAVGYDKNGTPVTPTNQTAVAGGTITISNLAAGTYANIRVTLSGCASNVVGPFTLSDPNPPATPTAGSNSPLCSGQTLSLTANSATSGVSYQWSGPNGFSNTVQSPTRSNITIADAGIYSVTAMLAGCSSPAGTVTVVVNQTPVTPTIVPNSPVCSGTTVNLNATTSTSGVSWNWTGPNGFTSPVFNPSISNASTASGGTYTVTATLGTCTSATASTIITVKPTPSITATASNPTACNSATGLITISGLSNNTNYTYNYRKNGVAQSTGSGTSSSTGTLVIGNLTAGTYDNVTVTLSGCPSNAVGPFTLSDPNPPATPVPTVNSPICEGGTLTLGTTAVTGAVYTWTGPNSFSNNLQNPTITNATVAANGTYSLTVTVAGCASAAGTVAAVVNATPVITTVGGHSPVCTGTAINLSANSNFAGQFTWSWSGPNGFTSTLQNPTINNATVNDAGNYTVIATATTGACASASRTVTIVVNPTPVIVSAVANNPTNCNAATGSIELNGLTAGATYSLNYTKNGTAETPRTITANASGVVIVNNLSSGAYDNISVNLSGCASNQVGPYTLVDPNPPATPVVTSSGPVCSGNTLTLNASTTTAGIITWSWTGPNAFIRNAQSPSINNVSLAANGIYSVTATLNGCISVAGTVNVVVNETPAAAAISSNTPVCTGNPITLFSTTSFTGALTYSWNGPNGFTSSLPNPSIANATLAETGNYKLVVTATTGSCPSAESTMNVVVNPTPVITGTNSTDPTNCNTATGSIIVKGLSASATYTVSYTKGSTPQTATVMANTSGDVIISNLTAGIYSNVSVSLSSCSSNTVGPFTLTDPNPPALPVAGSTGPICSGTTLLLNASTVTTGNLVWSWTGPNGFVSNQQNPFIADAAVAASGTYSVTVTQNSCVSAAGVVNVVVNETPAMPTVGSNGPLCAGSTLNLTASTATPGTMTWSWTGPSGFVSNEQNPNITNATQAATGTYAVTATSTQGACPSPSASVPVTVHPELVNEIDMVAKTLCYGQSVTVSSTTISGGNGTYTYQWEQSADNLTWTSLTGQTSASITIAPATSLYLRRKVSSNPCQSFSLSVYIAVQPPVSNNTVQKDEAVCVNTAASTLIGSVPAGANGVYDYRWEKSTDNGSTWSVIGGATAKDFSPGVLALTTQFRRIVTTSLCTGPQSSTSNAVTVTVRPDAKASFLPKDTLNCPPFNISPANVNLQTYPAQNGSYQWFANGVLIGSGTFPGYTIVNEDDSVTIKLKAISLYGCKDDSLSRKFYTYKLPHPSFNLSDTVGCGPLTVQIQNTTPNTQLFTYFWSFGNGQTSSLAQPSSVIFQPNPAYGDTIYKVKLKVFSVCDTVTVSKDIRVKSKPKALFTPTKTVGCSPMHVTFKNTSKGTNNTYFWNFGDGTTLSTTNPDSVQHTFVTGAVDTFYVKLKAVNECGADSLTYSIIVAPNSIRLNLAVNGTDHFGCEPHPVSFINNSQGASVFLWNFGDGANTTTTKNVDTVQHTYLSPGTYTVRLQAINNCSDTTTTETIVVYPKPKASFTANKFSVCIGDSVRFLNQSDSATAYLWTFGDCNTSTLTNPFHLYTTPGSYVVSLVAFRNNASGNVCTDSAKQTVTVSTTQTGFFTVSDSVGQCSPFTVTFVNKNKPSVSAVWDLGDGTTATGDSLVHTYTTAGTYLVKLTVKVPGGCTYITTKMINVLGPKGTLQYNYGYVCSPSAVQFQAVATGASTYAWDFGDGTVLNTTQQTVFHSYNNPGYYLPKVTLQSSGCNVLLKGIDTVKVDKVDGGFTFAKNEICGATTLTFTDTSHVFFGSKSIAWNFGDNTSAAGNNPSHVYTASGRYTVQMIVQSNSSCTDTVSKQIDILVKSKPIVSINATDTACTRRSIAFNALVQTVDPLNLVQWNLSNGATGTGPQFNYTFTQTGTYNVQLIAGTVNGCYDTAYHTVRINPSPVVTATPPLNLCKGNTVQLNAIGASIWQWLPLQGLSCYTCPNPIASPTVTTPYVVEGKNSFGCADWDTVVITVVQPLKMTVAPDDSICIGQSVNLLASGATFYSWSPAIGLNNVNISNPTASPAATTRYRVVGYDGFNCFTDTAYVTVAIGQYPTVSLGPDQTLATGTLYPLTPVITNRPIKTWNWTPTTNLSCNNCALPIAEIKKDITYSVTVTTPYGCSASDTISIKVFCKDGQVFIPNAFTPDGDGINDVLTVRASGIVMVKYFRIFNRWGDLIFERTNFKPNDPNYGWDGKVRGVVNGPEVFVYTCEAVCENGASYTYKGNVSIIK